MYHPCDYYVFTDINECTAGTQTCDAMATCMNTMGSYECMCNMGYEGDGFMCTGITLKHPLRLMN